MTKIKIPIIPNSLTFVGKKKSLDYEAICVFAAIGFFLDDDTYYKEQKALKPAHEYTIEDNKINSFNPYFKWHYAPVERPLSVIVTEFAHLFETIIKEQAGSQKVILPLSGGLDSRTIAVALKYLNKDVTAYSYSFLNGLDENKYGNRIAKICDFPFHDLRIVKGYLWDKIEDLAKINGCYAEFTNPRQMAFIDKYKTMGDVFFLGHLGDHLFDSMGVDDQLSLDDQVAIILKKTVKNGGLELANRLWKEWDLEGHFEAYLHDRILKLLREINIKNSANAAIRAFKSIYYVNRWTNTNLSVFESVNPIKLPYYDDRMCQFICSIPEKYLAGRQIQIEYIKLRNPVVASIEWQSQRPFNLYTYKQNKIPYNLPFRIFRRIKRIVSGKKIIQRNWELQFVGKENEAALKKWLFENTSFQELIPKDIVADFYDKFTNKDAVYYSHPVSMLLTLSLFSKQKNNAT